tara:strand:+ start:162 stop:419 length:258 start_codon:yes stop_codon:yes gene_type:complete
MIRIIGFTLNLISGLFGLLIWFGIWMDWIPFFGFFIALILSPGVIIFPFVFWLIEGHLPQLYLMMWGLGVLGMLIVAFGNYIDQK